MDWSLSVGRGKGNNKLFILSDSMAGSTIETRIKSEERGTGNSVSVQCINAPERIEGIYNRRRRNKLNERWFISYECFYESSRRITFGPLRRWSGLIWEILEAPLMISLVWSIHPRLTRLDLFVIPNMFCICAIASVIEQSAFKQRYPTCPSNVTTTNRSFSFALCCLATHNMYNSAVEGSFLSSYLQMFMKNYVTCLGIQTPIGIGPRIPNSIYDKDYIWTVKLKKCYCCSVPWTILSSWFVQQVHRHYRANLVDRFR